MMRRLLGLPFEMLNVLGTAIFFAISGALTLLSAPNWLAKISKMSADAAAKDFHETASLIGRHGWWVAGAALVGAAVAPFARGDGKKAIAWVRVVCAASALVIVAMQWGFETGGRLHEGGRPSPLPWRSDKDPTPWNALLAATGVNLALGAFLVSGGAAAKKSKGGEKEK